MPGHDRVQLLNLELVYREQRARLEGYVRRRTRSLGEAEEITSEVWKDFFIAWVKGPELKSPEALLFTIARARVVDRHRRYGRLEHLPGDDALVRRAQELADLTASGIERQDTQLDLSRALAQLRPRHRQVIVLTYLDDLNQATVAAIMKLSTRRVRQLLREAITALRSSDDLAGYQRLISSGEGQGP